MKGDREICPKTNTPCAAGCGDPLYAMKVTGYCYEKERAGDYSNPALTERGWVVAWLRKIANKLRYSQYRLDGRIRAGEIEGYADAIDRGDHVKPEPVEEERDG